MESRSYLRAVQRDLSLPERTGRIHIRSSKPHAVARDFLFGIAVHLPMESSWILDARAAGKFANAAAPTGHYSKGAPRVQKKGPPRREALKRNRSFD